MALSLAWGGHSNGRIPVSALGKADNFNPLWGEPVGPYASYMRSDAARAWHVMDAHYFATTGRHLSLSEGYRDYGDQNNRWGIYQRTGHPLAAYPGTSLHGWGLSADVGTEGRSWMTINGPRFGWSPTGKNFGKPEPWHFDFLGGGDITKTPAELNGSNPASGGKPTPILIPVSNGDNMIQVIINDTDAAGTILDIAPGFIHHAGSMQEATIVMQVTSNPDERHRVSYEDFKRICLGHGIDRHFFEAGPKALAELDKLPWGGFWSQERANGFKLDTITDLLKK